MIMDSLGRGVTGNTPDFGSGVSRFESWRPSHFCFATYVVTRLGTKFAFVNPLRCFDTGVAQNARDAT
jgi:hypothetical protein